VSNLTIGLLSALLATNQPQAVSNLIQQHAGISVSIANPNDPAESELQKILDDDDAAQAEVDKWIRDNNAFAANGAGESKDELNRRILARFDSVRKNYESFLRHYPNNAHGYLAYGSFLNDLGDEDNAAAQFEKSSRLDPKNPAAWNNLANYFGEHGPVTNAFVYYAKAIALNPSEPVYYQNLGTTVYLFRKDAKEFYDINEQQVFDKSLALYRKAVQLDPDNFPLATDYAQSYYGIKPLRTNDALVAWTNALNTAHNDDEREGVFIHLARIKIAAGFFAEARAQLNAVTNSMYDDLKKRLERSLVQHEMAATNSVLATPTNRLSEISENVIVEKTNLPAEISTNVLIAPTNAIVPTKALPVLTNQIPALPNPLVPSTNAPGILTNVPPVSPRPTPLQSSPINMP
jgi:tetratricopeptide (TPR) repeat protein